jgi:hypothetical protein|tara:strand:- start:213 stop:590 length:378 start_codon:yes stop_codon:yes gene_type:complete
MEYGGFQFKTLDGFRYEIFQFRYRFSPLPSLDFPSVPVSDIFTLKIKYEKKDYCNKYISISFIRLVLLGYFSLGIFVVQPMGAIPDGGSVLYVRLGTNLDFFESPDSLSENLLERFHYLVGQWQQ